MILAYANYDIGYVEPEHNVNEDFAHLKVFPTDKGDVFFAVVADGAGSNGTPYQPAILASIQIEEAIERLCQNHLDAFLSNPQAFLEEALVSASYSLQTFRIVDEQRYNGFATSLSCVLIHNDKFTFAHTGNTRIHLIRKAKMKQLTTDQTKGMQEVNNGMLDFNEYHLHRSRLEVTGGLGTSATPKIQTFSSPLKEQDILLMTSDGIHCAIRPDIIMDILAQSNTCADMIDSLIQTAKFTKYPDNMSAVIIWNAKESTTGEKENGDDNKD